MIKWRDGIYPFHVWTEYERSRIRPHAEYIAAALAAESHVRVPTGWEISWMDSVVRHCCGC